MAEANFAAGTAAMTLLSDWNGNLPRWLDWLPHVAQPSEPGREAAPGARPAAPPRGPTGV
ncbi:hypothetical protein FSW04_15500 [Baekduia soli]|uniref:Uncharacterized protein n=1 Tax=Baekduia soli TaxID=496014 RepID=A0A5B8U6S6_9ACTN|nr:hypothetical protein [Baekduia soli]QEC48839.1 hypothetical protein FSW04_15500 [Baekduia soli]